MDSKQFIHNSLFFFDLYDNVESGELKDALWEAYSSMVEKYHEEQKNASLKEKGDLPENQS